MQRWIERDLLRQIRTYLNDSEMIVIHGARQVGKTSLARLIMEELAASVPENSLFWLDLDDPVYLDLCNRGIEEVLRYARGRGFETGGRFYIFVDEIQYLAEPSAFLKLAYDRYQGKVKLIVTGSSSFAVKSKFKDSLAGRILDFELFPLNFEEFLRFKGLSYDLSAVDVPEAVHGELSLHFRDYMRKGGYPAIVLEPVEEKQEKKLTQIIQTYIRTDIRDLGKIRNLQKFNHLLAILASQTGRLVNISELSSTVGLARQTVEEYLFILENTYVIKMLYPFFQNLRSELTKLPKVFFEDTGVARLLENRTFAGNITGAAFENAVFSEIRKRSGVEILHFWRTNKQHEVDFIIAGDEIVPMEVKLSYRKRDLTSLKYFVDKYKIAVAWVCTLEKIHPLPYPWLRQIYPWEIGKVLQPHPDFDQET